MDSGAGVEHSSFSVCNLRLLIKVVFSVSLIVVICLYALGGNYIPFTAQESSLLTEGSPGIFRPIPKCQLQVDGTLDQKRNGTKLLDRNSDQPCTFALFREYYKSYNYLPGDGEWHLDSETPYFQPKFCKLKYQRIPKNVIDKCLVKGNVKSLTTMGDSNGGRHSEAHRHQIGNCRTIKREALKEGGFLPDKEYYKSKNKSDVWNNFLQVHYRFCSGCASVQETCHSLSPTGRAMNFEHIAMTMVLDDSVQIHIPTYHQSVHTVDKAWALTSQELTFSYFLKGRYPDILLVFLPFNHAKHLINDRVRIDMEYFRSMLEFYAPKTTKIVYMPTSSEFESKRTSKPWINATFENMLATAKIDSLNHIMYKLLEKDLLNPLGRTYSFLDLVKLSLPLESWSIDGVHMSASWYQLVSSMFWETLCNSIEHDAF